MVLPPRRLAVAAIASMSLALLAADLASAQSADKPSVSVAATIAGEAATQVPFPIRISPASSVPRNSFVRIRGLPAVAALSEGHAIAPGSWAVSIAALPELKIILPAGATGKADVVVSLVGNDGSVLVEAKSTLVIAAPADVAKSQANIPATVLPPAVAPSLRPVEAQKRAGPAPPQQAPPAMPTAERERALKLLKEGDRHIAEGNVAAARVVYELAAEQGLAQAAMALAGTYDGAELDRLNVRGIQPNPQLAKRWYERARELGEGEAEQRLRRLGAK